MRYWLTALTIIVIDQWTKWLVASKMALGDSITVIDGFFHLTSHRNRGAAFGILQNQKWFFITVTSIVICALIYFLWASRKEHPLMKWGYASVLGGALGNYIDRVRMGEVVDFLHFQFGSYDFAIFNVADSAVCVGVAILFLGILLEPGKPVPEKLESNHTKEA
ncbi:signal peptidase II [Croceifilum oryzae]|uniref:Lipoprotein signal peptidase n=1 Tax=Croceifilum oryzae TaxID=1553429 RepID=A0AAJ1WPC7_9BACL|nr:signal peptidase II [Croceifilum oryzae]MDQ0416412.1 signal peptidase II [Croceifilum oryzae]